MISCAAAFGWLCVETIIICFKYSRLAAAAFGWLCVETKKSFKILDSALQPPSGGCVLKLSKKGFNHLDELAAAFGWLCVETLSQQTHLA